VLNDLGMNGSTSAKGGKNDLANFDHQSVYDGAPDVNQQWYPVQGQWYRATGASYSFTVNPVDGIIIALNRESPQHAAKERNLPVPADGLPRLNQFSDVAWIEWQSIAGFGLIRNMENFLSVSIVNIDTTRVLTRALQAKWVELDYVPGHTFERTDPEMKAILGRFGGVR
jgi:hypothetical protein